MLVKDLIFLSIRTSASKMKPVKMHLQPASRKETSRIQWKEFCNEVKNDDA